MSATGSPIDARDESLGWRFAPPGPRRVPGRPTWPARAESRRPDPPRSVVSESLPARDRWTGSDPLEGRGQRVKTRRAPRPHQALGLGGRSPPRPCCPVRHRRPGGDERNSKRPHGIGESGVCASSGVHCVHRPPTSHARSSTAQVVGFSSESRPHEPNRPAMCRCAASAPDPLACAHASTTRRCASWRPASRRTP